MSLGGDKNKAAGNTTVTQVNPTQQAQIPFLTQGWGAAQNLYGNNPLTYYPGQTLANFNPYTAGGYNQLAAMGVPAMEQAAAQGGQLFGNAMTGGMGYQNSPAYSLLSMLGYGNAGPQQQTAAQAGNLTNVGNQALANMPGWANTLATTGGLGLTEIPGFANNAQSYGTQAVGTGNQYAAGANNVGNSAARQLGGIGMGAFSNPANSLLEQNASGAFLNSNPYLSGMFSAASQPVVNAYQTATAPQTDSAMEAAGRYGSGALSNAQGQNQLNLGTTLGNLASNIYGQNYQNERNLMTQAQSALGNLGLGETQTAGNIVGQGLAQQLAGVEAGGNLANQAYNTGIAGSQAGGNLLNAGINTALSGYGAGANALNAGYNTAAGAYGAGGNLNNALSNLMLGGASGLQSAFDTGNSNALRALMMEPSVTSGFAAGPQAMTGAGQGLQGLQQQQIQDAMARYYGTQQAPWQTLNQYLNALGEPTSGSATTTQPYFTNPTANVLGAGLGGLGLYNGLNTATGGGLGGLLGGLFGGGAAAGGAADAAANFALSPLSFLV